ncbi:hypothetical protein C8A01DRAFT_18206 [Parachaetomium inaequale]|uniref:Uncharacterized protein n=1 Tax=Parachaetomium inaequale TaxID=2588326 RepID=A0AAN6PES7_9PEZI|nr:hypothetical protein C8A01DRAFT_18206 [Parachaetomium inaequale]
MSSASPQLNSSSCPTGEASIPTSFASIPTNISYVAVPGQNVTERWMVRCCEPYPVQLVDGCWEWCQIDPEQERNVSQQLLEIRYDACFRNYGRPLSESGSMYHFHSGAGAAVSARVSVLRSVVVALAASGVVALVSGT